MICWSRHGGGPMTRIRGAAAAAAIVTVLTPTAFAQQPKATAATGDVQPTLLGQFGDWGAYTASPRVRQVLRSPRQAKNHEDRAAARPRPQARSVLCLRVHPSGRERAQRSIGDHRLSVQDQLRRHCRGRHRQVRDVYAERRRLDQERRRGGAHGRRHAQGGGPHGEGYVRPRHPIDRPVFPQRARAGTRPRRSGVQVTFPRSGRTVDRPHAEEHRSGIAHRLRPKYRTLRCVSKHGVRPDSGRPHASRRAHESPVYGIMIVHPRSSACGRRTCGNRESAATMIRVGIGGWVFAPWRGEFYPKGLPQARELEHASCKLTSIEINGTFYRTQKPDSFRKWAAETPDDFVFSLKGPQFATNRRLLAEAGSSIQRFFKSGVLELKSKLGPILRSEERRVGKE